jgi:hypothetical protein
MAMKRTRRKVSSGCALSWRETFARHAASFFAAIAPIGQLCANSFTNATDSESSGVSRAAPAPDGRLGSVR